jgi:hypothetical protein
MHQWGGAICATLLATTAIVWGQQPAVEIASVKPNRSNDLGIRIDLPGGRRFTATNVPLRELIRFAYDVQEERLIGGPDWSRSERFDVDARADRELPGWGTAGPPAEVLNILRLVLAERFHLVVHRENRELSVYALVSRVPIGSPVRICGPRASTVRARALARRLSEATRRSPPAVCGLVPARW